MALLQQSSPYIWR